MAAVRAFGPIGPKIDIKNYKLGYKGYAYDGNIKETLMSLKRQYPNAKFIIYTSPEYYLLFKSILDANLYASYERWLNDLVEVFGEVYDFSSPNSVNNNINNFLDGSHFHPSVGTWIANKITGTQDPSIPPDFGILITKDNVNGYLSSLKKNIEETVLE